MASAGTLGPTGYRLVPAEPAGAAAPTEPAGGGAPSGPPALSVAAAVADGAPLRAPLDATLDPGAGADCVGADGRLSPLEGRLEAIESTLEAAEQAADLALQARQRLLAPPAHEPGGSDPVPTEGSGSQFAEAFSLAFSEYCLPGGGAEPAAAPQEDSPRTLDPTPNRPPPDVPLVGVPPAARGSVVLVNSDGLRQRALAPELPERGVATHQQPAEPLARWLASRGAPSAQSRPALAPQVVAKYETEPRELCRIVTSRCIASAPAAPPAPAAAPAATPPPRRCPPPPDPAAGLPLPAQPASGTPQRRTAGEPSAPPPPARAAAPPPWECPPALDPAAGAPAPSACGPPQERSAGEPSAPPALMRAAVGARLAPGPAAAPAGLAQDSPLFRPQRFDFYRDEGGARAASGAWAPQAASPPPQLEWFPCAWPCSAPAQQPVLSPAHWCGPAPLMQPPLGGASAAGGGFAPPPPPPPERVPVRESVPPPQAAAAHAERDALLASARKLEEKVQELLSGQEGLRHELEQVRMEVRDSSRQFLEQPCGPAAGFQDLPEVGPALMQPTQVLYRSDQWGGPSLQPDTVFYPHAEQQPPSPRREFPQNRLLSQPALQAELVLPGQSTAPPAQTRATYPESARPAERSLGSAPAEAAQAFHDEGPPHAEAVGTHVFYPQGAKHVAPPPNPPPLDTQVLYPPGAREGGPPPGPASPPDARALAPLGSSVLPAEQVLRSDSVQSQVWYPQSAEQWERLGSSPAVQQAAAHEVLAPQGSGPAAHEAQPHPASRELRSRGAPTYGSLPHGSGVAAPPALVVDEPAGPPAPPANLGFGRSQEFIDRWTNRVSSIAGGGSQRLRKSACA